MADDPAAPSSINELTADIVAAFVAANPLPAADLADLIRKVHDALVTASSAPTEAAVEDTAPKITPAMIRKSITPDALISFLDGKPYKMLRRHLATHGHTPQTYREHYRLPKNYPMVAQAHSEMRSQLAKRIGLGAHGKGGKPAKAPPKARAKRGL